MVDSTESIRRLAFTTLAANLLTAAIGFAAGVVISRGLGPTGRGDLAAFQLVPTVAALIFAFGLPHAATYFTAHEPARAASTVRVAARFALMTGLVGALAAAAAGWWYLTSTADESVRTAGLVQAAIVALMPVLGVLIHPLRSIGRNSSWNVLRVVLDSSLVAAAVLVVIGQTSYVRLAVAQVAWLLVLAVVARSFWPRAGGDDAVTTRQLIGFGFPTMMATLPYFLNFKVDQLILLAITNNRELGVYAVAVTWSTASMPITTTVAHLTLPRLVAKGADRGSSSARLFRVSVLLAALCAVALAATAPVVIPLLYGSDFSAAVPLSMALCAATAILGVTTTVEEALRAAGDVNSPARIQLIGLAFNVAALTVLVPALSAWGAVVASAVAYVAVFVAVTARLARISRVPLKDFVPTWADVVALVALVRPARAR